MAVAFRKWYPAGFILCLPANFASRQRCGREAIPFRYLYEITICWMAGLRSCSSLRVKPLLANMRSRSE